MDGEVAQLAMDLDLEKEVVENAFAYWIRKGLIKEQGATYLFMDPKNVVVTSHASSNYLNQHSDFVSKISSILQGRNIKPSELDKIFDWRDIYYLSEDCILSMLHYAVTQKFKKGASVNFSSLDKLAISWKELGIDTGEKAKEYITTQEVINSEAKAVLRRLGQYRNPTVDEYNLIKKWTGEYGFTLEAIISDGEQMTFSNNPSFALLNTIVTEYYENGITDKAGIEKKRIIQREMHGFYKDLYKRMGGYGNITPGKKASIDETLALGFNKQGLIYIADYLDTCSKASMQNFVELSKDLHSKGIIEENAVCEHLDTLKAKDDNIKEFIQTIGFTRKPNQSDIALYNRFFAVFNSHEILLKAANLSSKEKNKLKAVEEILLTWKDKNVTSINKANDINSGYITGNENVKKKDMFDFYK